MSSSAPKKLISRSFEFLSSMPLAIILLCVVALSSMIGTVLEQNQSADHYLSILGPFWYKIFAALGLYNMRSEERRVGKECRSRCSPDH